MKKVLYIFIVLVTLYSCNKEEFLDIKPRGVVIPINVADYRLLLDQQGPSFDEEAGRFASSPGFVDTYSNQEFLSDDIFLDAGASFLWGPINVNFHTFQNQAYDIVDDDRDWLRLYGQIYVCNFVLDEIMSAANGTLQEKLQLEAEAKLHRAYAYFALVNLYGLHYNPTTSATDLAVPLRLGIDTEEALPRVSVQEIYDFIFEETLSAMENLPNLPESLGLSHRPSKAGVYAFLARLYLYTGDFEKALDAANDALEISNTLTDYNDLDEAFGGVAQSLFYFENTEILWYKSAGEHRGFFAQVSDDLLNLHDSNDLRLKRYGPYSEFGFPFEGSLLFSVFTTNDRIIGPSTAEMYLTRAECNARLGNVSTAVTDLDLLRINRMETGTFSATTSTNQTEVLDLIKKERRLEFALAGHRFFDLKRYNEYDNANISITHTYNGETFTLPANSKNWALPVHQRYISSNPEIGDNVRD